MVLYHFKSFKIRSFHEQISEVLKMILFFVTDCMSMECHGNMFHYENCLDATLQSERVSKLFHSSYSNIQ